MANSNRVMVLGAGIGEVEAICETLKNAGFLAQGATQPKRAIEVDQSWPLNVLVVPEIIGDMSGMDLVMNLRKRNTTLRALVIAEGKLRAEMLTATSDGSIKVLCRPFQNEELLHYVQTLSKSAATQTERRDHARYLSSIEATCAVVNPFNNSRSLPIPCMTRDVSRSGLSMLSHRLIPVPTMLKIEIRLPDSPRTLNPLAKSLSCTLTPIQDVYRIGLKFIGLLPSEIETALAGLSKADAYDDDLYVGRSYMQALEKWLQQNVHELAESNIDPEAAKQAVDKILSDIHRKDRDGVGR